MALLKNFETPAGAIGNYWKVVSLDIDTVHNNVHAVLALFINKVASDNKKHSLREYRSVDFALLPQMTTLNTIKAACYAKARVTDFNPSTATAQNPVLFFSDAADI